MDVLIYKRMSCPRHENSATLSPELKDEDCPGCLAAAVAQLRDELNELRLELRALKPSKLAEQIKHLASKLECAAFGTSHELVDVWEPRTLRMLAGLCTLYGEIRGQNPPAHHATCLVCDDGDIHPCPVLEFETAAAKL